MTVQTVPYALQNASHSAALFRQSASSPWASGGILAAGELAVSQQATPNMSVILGPGRAKVVGTAVSPPSGLLFTTQGMYDVLNDASISLTVTAANATNPRIDAVYIQVQDSFYSGSTNTVIAGIVAGLPAPSPVAPVVPTNAVLLGYIAVAANATTIVTANISATGTLAQLVNSAYALSVGTFSTQFTAQSSTISSITFPAGRFTAAPAVFAILNSSPGTARKVTGQATGTTASGTQIVMTTGDQSSITTVALQVVWFAIQMTPTSVSG